MMNWCQRACEVRGFEFGKQRQHTHA
jgi:hypothetical protein